MSSILFFKILLSEEDCKALQKEPFRNSCGSRLVEKQSKKVGGPGLMVCVSVPVKDLSGGRIASNGLRYSV